MADRICKETRKKHNLTRDDVSITHDDVMLIDEIYGEPILCNHYCSKECPIGENTHPKSRSKTSHRLLSKFFRLSLNEKGLSITKTCA